jgi:hypothetical protein
MPSRIGNYSEKTSSPAERDFASLNLLICGNLNNRSTQVMYETLKADQKGNSIEKKVH